MGLRSAVVSLFVCAVFAPAGFAQERGGEGAGASAPVFAPNKSVRDRQIELNSKRPKGARPLIVDGIEGLATKRAQKEWTSK
jgi:hypothetical protein